MVSTHGFALTPPPVLRHRVHALVYVSLLCWFKPSATWLTLNRDCRVERFTPVHCSGRVRFAPSALCSSGLPLFLPARFFGAVPVLFIPPAPATRVLRLNSYRINVRVSTFTVLVHSRWLALRWCGVCGMDTADAAAQPSLTR